MPLFLRINGHIYDCSGFIDLHPGEGIHDVFLRHYSGKEVSSEYDHYHFDDEPEEILLRARTTGADEDNHVYYVAEDPFSQKRTRKVPAFFRYYREAATADALLAADLADKGTFVVVAAAPRNAEGASSYTFVCRLQSDADDAELRRVPLRFEQKAETGDGDEATPAAADSDAAAAPLNIRERASGCVWRAKHPSSGDAIEEASFEKLIEALTNELTAAS